MKKNVIFLVCLMLSVVAFGQNERSNPNKDESFAPEFIGSNTETLNDYLARNLVYPKKAAKNFIEGTEVVQFTVTPAGNVTNCNVMNSVCPEIDKEVIRVLETTNGMWTVPGAVDGEAAALTKEVGIRFAFCNEGKVVNSFTREATRYYEAGIKNLKKKNNPGKALLFINQAMNYLPNDPALFVARGLCYYELGDTVSAENDWKQAAALDEKISRKSDYDLSSFKGIAQMVQIRDNKK